MPNVWAIRTGLWSTGSTWNTGTVPTSADDVFISGSGFTVTIDQDINVLSLNTIATGSIAAGGSFSVTGSRNIRANVIRAGTANCLNISGTSITVNITGSVSGSNSNSISTVNVTAVSSSINVSGSFLIGGFGGAGNQPAINANGTLNTYNIIMGSIRAGTSSTSNSGILIRGDRETLIVTGSIIGNSVTNNQAINGISSISNNPYTLFVSGNATAGILAPAINLNGQGAGTAGTGVGTFNFVGNSTGGPGPNTGVVGILINNVTGSITGSMIGGAASLNTGLSIAATSLIGISGSITGSGGAGVAITGNSNTLTITGSVATFGFSAGGAFNTVSILGNCIGSPNGASAISMTNASAFYNMTINGNLIGATIAGGNFGYGLDFRGSFHTCSIFGDNIPGRNGGGLGFNNTTACLVNLNGNVRSSAAGGANVSSVHFWGTTDRLTLNISGSIFPGESGAGTAGSNNFGIRFEAGVTNTTINISGSVFAGGTGSFTQGIHAGSNAGSFNTINILGNLVAGPTGSSTSNIGIFNNQLTSTTINVLGSAIAGSAPAISNTVATAAITVGTAIASVTASSVSNTGNIPAIYEAATFATNGVIPISGRALLRQGNNNFISCSLVTGGYKTLINVNNISNGLPAASDIRRGTIYNFGDGVGTMAVPSASYVDSGVAVGNTVGTAVYTTASLATTMWNTNVAALTGSNSVGERLRNISTVSSTGDQLVALL